jgi:hypothetical protein
MMWPVDRSDVERWVDRYIEAWGSNDPAAIAHLFTEGARSLRQGKGERKGRPRRRAGSTTLMERSSRHSKRTGPDSIDC